MRMGRDSAGGSGRSLEPSAAEPQAPGRGVHGSRKRSELATNVVIAPIWHVNAQKRFEQATVVLNSEMKQFVDDDKVLEAIVLIG